MLKVINDDCIKVMDEMIDNGVKVDAIITDPPYNIARKNNFHTMKNKYGKQAHRKGIDFGEWDKNVDLFSWIDRGVKLLDKNGSMFIENQILIL